MRESTHIKRARETERERDRDRERHTHKDAHLKIQELTLVFETRVVDHIIEVDLMVKWEVLCLTFESRLNKRNNSMSTSSLDRRNNGLIESG